jgi:hypothetical protein
MIVTGSDVDRMDALLLQVPESLCCISPHLIIIPRTSFSKGRACHFTFDSTSDWFKSLK